MPCAACLLLASLLGLWAAACFVVPSGPRSPGAGPAGGMAAAAPAVEVPEMQKAPVSAAWSPLAFAAALGLLAAVLGGRPALAADLENGEGVFAGNCAACHAGGNNSVVAEKKIKKAELEKYLTGGFNVDV